MGALIRTYQFGFDPRNLSGIFVSHAHTDHYNDAEILIEAMTKGIMGITEPFLEAQASLKDLKNGVHAFLLTINQNPMLLY